MCVGDRDLHRERAPAKIFINFSRKHVLKMKNKQMYKCNLREIHYASQPERSGVQETAWERGVSVCAEGLQGGTRLPPPARAALHSDEESGGTTPLKGGRSETKRTWAVQPGPPLLYPGSQQRKRQDSPPSPRRGNLSEFCHVALTKPPTPPRLLICTMFWDTLKGEEHEMLRGTVLGFTAGKAAQIKTLVTRTKGYVTDGH